MTEKTAEEILGKYCDIGFNKATGRKSVHASVETIIEAMEAFHQSKMVEEMERINNKPILNEIEILKKHCSEPTFESNCISRHSALMAMAAYHDQFNITDEEIDEMFPKTFYDGTITLDDKLYDIKRSTAKKLHDRIFNK